MARSETAAPPAPETSRRGLSPGVARLIRFAIPVALGVVLWFIPPPAGIGEFAAEGYENTGTQPWHLLAIFVATILAIILKPLPMGALCMIGMAVVATTGTLSISDTLSGFGNTTIWLIVMAFFISRGVIKTGLGTRIALFFVSRLGKRTLGLSYGLAMTDLVLAPATPSNTARAGGIIMPILKSISLTYDSEPNSPSAKRVGAYLTQTAFLVNCVTSAMFLTAMAANPLAAELAGQQGVTISWGQWALAASVPGLVSLVVIPLLMYRVFGPELKETPQAAAAARTQLDELGSLTRHEWIMAGTIVLLLLLWTLGGPLFDMSATTVAMIGLSVLLLVGVLTWEDVKTETQAWDTLVWFAALVMMATFLNTLGLIPWLSDRMSTLVGDMNWIVAFVVLTLVYYFSHYLFASNTAHVSAMYAAFLATAIAAGAPPLFSALVFGFISSLFATLTHYSSGPAPVLFGVGYVPLGAWWRNGLIAAVALIALWTTIGGGWMKLLGMW